MVPERLCAALALVSLWPAPIAAQPGQAVTLETPLAAAAIPPGAQPSLAELEAALLDYNRRLAAHPLACRKGVGCIKPPKAIKVRSYDCQARGTDSKGRDILYCRVTYSFKGGSFNTVKSPNECVPLRAIGTAGTIDGERTELGWELAMVDEKGKCPGARH
ncbi:MAG TPA: hypothetical protein VGB04_10090 [Allosphingosinicella sp.]|jgi:hypothetical protein